MPLLLNAMQMKASDQYTINTLGVPSLTLMERASLACVDVILRESWDTARVGIVCGSGNNGGDGFAIGRLLLDRGITADCVFAGNMNSRTEETVTQMRWFEEAGGKILRDFHPESYTVVVDALFGIGLCRDITGSFAELIKAMNSSRAKKLAVDVPSGVSSTDGRILGTAFCADVTVTFQNAKIGLFDYPGALCAGRVEVCDIGIDISQAADTRNFVYTASALDMKQLLPVRPVYGNKGTFGKVLLIAGSEGMAGAAYLSAKSAYRSGAGLVKIFTPIANREILQTLIPEAILSCYDAYSEEAVLRELAWADVVCIGPGIGKTEISGALIKAVLKECRKVCIIDADALNLLSEDLQILMQARDFPVILTPHMKEFSRLCGLSLKELKENRTEHLKEFCSKYGVIVVQKDARTLVSGPEGPVYLNTTGNSAMAKAGSGDVLAGVITGLAAGGMSAFDASVLGVYMHGLAGDIARDRWSELSVLARDLADCIGDAYLKLKGL